VSAVTIACDGDHVVLPADVVEIKKTAAGRRNNPRL